MARKLVLDLVQKRGHVCKTCAEAVMSECRELQCEGGASKMDGLSIKLGRAALLVRRLLCPIRGDTNTLLATRELRNEDINDSTVKVNWRVKEKSCEILGTLLRQLP